jgi:hypothetical protein
MTWASTISGQVREIITVFNAEELDALNAAPDHAIGWADRGTSVTAATGIAKIPYRLPQSLGFQPFEFGGPRTYQSLDVAAVVVKPSPWSLNFAWPISWTANGSGAVLMSESADRSTQDFMGAGGLALQIVAAARAYKAQLVATLFYDGLTSAALSLTAKIKTIPQPGMTDGNAFFTNGTDSPQHYAHPFLADSGRFKNAYPAYGTLASKFADSLLAMTQKPHPTLPNMTMGLQVTDVIGPTWMRKRFFEQAIQMLSLQTTTTPGNLAAATTNPYSIEALQRAMNEVNFIGASGFGPIRYWIAPQLDNHPYFTKNNNANMTTGPGGGPADMWINIAAGGPQQGSYCHLAAPARDFMPYTRIYGPADPLSQSQRRVRLESDLDAGVAGGMYHLVDMFLGA